MKGLVHEFDPQIYPRKLWIAIGTGTFSDKFDGVTEWDNTADAVVDDVFCKETKKGGIFIRFENEEAIKNLETITHESSHAAMKIFYYIGASVDLLNQEPFSYLCGWVAKCIQEVKDQEQ